VIIDQIAGMEDIGLVINFFIRKRLLEELISDFGLLVKLAFLINKLFFLTLTSSNKILKRVLI